MKLHFSNKPRMYEPTGLILTTNYDKFHENSSSLVILSIIYINRLRRPLFKGTKFCTYCSGFVSFRVYNIPSMKRTCKVWAFFGLSPLPPPPFWPLSPCGEMRFIFFCYLMCFIFVVVVVRCFDFEN